MTALSTICPIPLRFGFDNRDNPPRDFHYVVDDHTAYDYFDHGPSEAAPHSVSEALAMPILTPKRRVLERLKRRLHGDDQPRLFVLDIPEPSGPNQHDAARKLDDYFRQLYTGVAGYLQQLPENAGEGLQFNRFAELIGILSTRRYAFSRETGVLFTRASEKTRQNSRHTRLHWDVAGGQERAVRYLAFIHGERKGFGPQSALNSYTDFREWYRQRSFKKPLSELTEQQLANLVCRNSRVLEDRYTVTLPANNGFRRFTMFLNTPQAGGLLHSVGTLSKAEESSMDLRRVYKQADVSAMPKEAGKFFPVIVPPPRPSKISLLDEEDAWV